MNTSAITQIKTGGSPRLECAVEPAESGAVGDGFSENAVPSLPELESTLISLDHALSRMAGEMPDGCAPQLEKLAALQERLQELRSEPELADRLAVRSRGRVVFVRLVDIDWMEASDNYVLLHVGGESHRLRQTMGRLERMLSAQCFLRISRTAIVNTERIQEIKRMGPGVRHVILSDGTSLPITRSYRINLRRLGLTRKRSPRRARAAA